MLSLVDEPAQEAVVAQADAPAPPPVTLADGVIVEPGSEEAAIVALSEQIISGIRTRDIAAFRAGCHPDLQAKASLAQFAAYIEEDQNYPGYGQTVYTSGFTVELSDFRQFRDTASFKFDWREGENLIGESDQARFEKVEGTWYMTSNPCLLR